MTPNNLLTTPSVESFKINPEPVDTDLESVRIIRAKNQKQFYDEIEASFDLPFVERLIRIRETLFPRDAFPALDINGKPPSQLITREIQDSKGRFPYLKALSAELLPNLSKLVDDLSDAIIKIEDEAKRQASALRLVSLIFTLGVVIHPAANGNGQTFKMLLLSYLHELAPSFKDRYIPLKFSNIIVQEKLDITTDFGEKFIKAPISDLEFTEEKDKALVRLRNECAAINHRYFDSDEEDIETYNYRCNLDIYKLFKAYAEQYNEPNILRHFHMQEWTKDILTIPNKRFVPRWLVSRFTKTIKVGEEMAPRYADDLFLDEIFIKTLVSRGHDRTMVKSTLGRANDEIEHVTHAMSLLLNPNSALLLKDYVLNGNEDLVAFKSELDETSKETFAIAFAQFNAVKKQLTDLLSSEYADKASIEEQLNLAEEYQQLANYMDILYNSKPYDHREIFLAVFGNESLDTQRKQLGFLKEYIHKRKELK